MHRLLSGSPFLWCVLADKKVSSVQVGGYVAHDPKRQATISYVSEQYGYKQQMS
jgi:hypothetical protein